MTCFAFASVFLSISSSGLFKRIISRYPKMTVNGVLISCEILESIFFDEISCLLKSTLIFWRSTNSQLICAASSINAGLSVKIMTFSSLSVTMICSNFLLICSSLACMPYRPLPIKSYSILPPSSCHTFSVTNYKM